MKTLLQLSLAGLLFLLHAQAAAYRVGDTVENFSLVNRATGQPMALKDFAGKIVLLDWFAWWCPFCQAAAPQLLDGVHEHYAARAGNPAGIPVVSVGVNLQANQEAQTQNFVNRAEYEFVWQDFNRAVANRFFPTGGQPLFAIINGVTNSPSHRPWELIYARQGYGQTVFPVADFRAAIDAVKAAVVPAMPPTLTLGSGTAANGVTLSIRGRTGVVYRVESSADLVGWKLEQEVTLSSETEAVPVQLASVETRFFRVVAP
jgi:thiol-disulfide isomerase/thioredoxin